MCAREPVYMYLSQSFSWDPRVSSQLRAQGGPGSFSASSHTQQMVLNRMGLPLCLLICCPVHGFPGQL